MKRTMEQIGRAGEKWEQEVGALVDSPDLEFQRVTTSMVQRLLRQCYALLRQELDWRSRRPPYSNNKKLIESILRDFEAATEDIQAAVATRVQGRLLEVAQQEVRRVFEDALSCAELLAAGVITKEDAAQPSGGAPAEAKKQISVPKGAAPPSPPETQPKFGPSNPSGQNQRQAAADHDRSIYSGRVRLNVQGAMRELMYFLEALRGSPELRLLQLTGDGGRGVDLELRLCKPLALKELLCQIRGVSEVSGPGVPRPENGEPLIEVLLDEGLAAPALRSS